MTEQELKDFIKRARKLYREHGIEKETRAYVKHGWNEKEARSGAERTYSAQFVRSMIKTKGDAQRALKMIGMN